VKNLPPDDEQLAVQKFVNAKLAPLASVSLYRIDPEEKTDTILTGIVFVAGPRRALVKRRQPVTIEDAPELIAAVEQWVNRRPGQSDRWSTDPIHLDGIDYRTVA
jgi:hypothetical protein